jgi:hypothetical protein
MVMLDDQVKVWLDLLRSKTCVNIKLKIDEKNIL